MSNKSILKLIIKIFNDIESFLKTVFLILVSLLSYFVFSNGYYDYKYSGNVYIIKPTGYQLATIVLNDWQQLRNFYLVLLMPIFLFVLINSTIKLKKRKFYHLIKGCIFWVVILLTIIFSFAIGSLFLDIIVVMDWR